MAIDWYPWYRRAEVVRLGPEVMANAIADRPLFLHPPQLRRVRMNQLHLLVASRVVVARLEVAVVVDWESP